MLKNDIWVAPGGFQIIVTEGAELWNKGGLITLLDEKGHKGDGVGYTKDMVSNEGYWVVFR